MILRSDRWDWGLLLLQFRLVQTTHELDALRSWTTLSIPAQFLENYFYCIYFPMIILSFSFVAAGTTAGSVKIADFNAEPHLQGRWESNPRTVSRMTFWAFTLF